MDGAEIRQGGIAGEPGAARSGARKAADRSALVTELDRFGVPGGEWRCDITDVSCGGMTLRSRRMVHPGRVLLIRVPLGPEGRRKLVGGVVREARYRVGDGYTLTVELQPVPWSAVVVGWAERQGLEIPVEVAGARRDE